MTRLALAPIFKNDLTWFNEFFTDGAQCSKELCLPVDIKELEKAYTITADLPGVKKEGISIDFQEGVLSISASREQSEEKDEGNYHRVERRKGSFQRSFRLGSNVDADKIQANYTDGVLHLTIPKVEAAQKRRIEIV